MGDCYSTEAEEGGAGQHTLQRGVPKEAGGVGPSRGVDRLMGSNALQHHHTSPQAAFEKKCGLLRRSGLNIDTSCRLEPLLSKSGQPTQVVKVTRPLEVRGPHGTTEEISLWNTSNSMVLAVQVIAPSSGASIAAIERTVKTGKGVWAIEVPPGGFKRFVEVSYMRVDGAAAQVGMKWCLQKPPREFFDTLRGAREIEIRRNFEQCLALFPEVWGGGGGGVAVSPRILDTLHSRGVHFVDPHFLPCAQSIGSSGIWPSVDKSGWARPTEYLAPLAIQPELFSRQAYHIDQGILGDCWLLSAIGVLADIRCPSGDSYVQHLFSSNSASPIGAYTVTLCVDGWWSAVLIDDYFPMSCSRPAFAKNKHEPQELWLSLLEKACAKKAGSYLKICGGSPGEALADLTGFPVWNFAQDSFATLFDHICSWVADAYAVTLGTPGRDHTTFTNTKKIPKQSRYYQSLGLTAGHSYCVLRVAVVTLDGRRCRLLQLRDPWGASSAVWKGRWGAESGVWTEALRAKLRYDVVQDGKFWIEWGDVTKLFDGGSVAFLSPHSREFRIRLSQTKRHIFTEAATFSFTSTPDPIQLLFHLRQQDLRKHARNVLGKHGAVDTPPYGNIRLQVFVNSPGQKTWQCTLDDSRVNTRDVFGQVSVAGGAVVFVAVSTNSGAPVQGSVVLSCHVSPRAGGCLRVHGGGERWNAADGSGVNGNLLATGALGSMPLAAVPMQLRSSHSAPLRSEVAAEVKF